MKKGKNRNTRQAGMVSLHPPDVESLFEGLVAGRATSVSTVTTGHAAEPVLAHQRKIDLRAEQDHRRY
jgi:hypothetical protein